MHAMKTLLRALRQTMWYLVLYCDKTHILTFCLLSGTKYLGLNQPKTCPALKLIKGQPIFVEISKIVSQEQKT